MLKFNKTKKEMLDCLQELAEEFGLSFQDFINYNEKKYSINTDDYKAVYPENQNLLYQSDKVYVQNLKVMLAHNLYKEGKTIKMNDKLSKLLGIEDPPINWYVSEKFDGIRAIWDGEKFVSNTMGISPTHLQLFERLLYGVQACPLSRACRPAD